jgi:hypothetical protein
MIPNDPDIELANQILRGQQSTAIDTLDLALRMKNQKRFGYARKLLFTARQDPSISSDSRLAAKLRQQHSLCTYKDADLPTDSKFDRALEILGQREDLTTTGDQKTFGIAGAIYENKWETFGQRADLERSLAYYQRGSRQGIEKDFGYTGINAAFILEVLAGEERTEARMANTTSASADSRIAAARAIRQDIATRLPPLAALPENQFLRQGWWFYVAVAEAGSAELPESRQRPNSRSHSPRCLLPGFRSPARSSSFTGRRVFGEPSSRTPALRSATPGWRKVGWCILIDGRNQN